MLHAIIEDPAQDLRWLHTYFGRDATWTDRDQPDRLWHGVPTVTQGETFRTRDRRPAWPATWWSRKTTVYLVECPHHWHCLPELAAHECAQGVNADREQPCPNCGAHPRPEVEG